jgi:dephospho-CoA kinase
MPDQEKVKRAGFLLPNDGSKAQLIRSVDRLYKKLLKITQKGSKNLDSREIMF